MPIWMILVALKVFTGCQDMRVVISALEARWSAEAPPTLTNGHQLIRQLWMQSILKRTTDENFKI